MPDPDALATHYRTLAVRLHNVCLSLGVLCQELHQPSWSLEGFAVAAQAIRDDLVDVKRRLAQGVPGAPETWQPPQQRTLA